MNNKAMVSVGLFGCITFVALMLIASVQIPIFLTAGSDALEVIVKTSNISQWLALALFLISWFVCFVLPKLKHKGDIRVKVALILITLSIFFMSGHNFRYSGKQHELVDRWFFIPMQTVSINPMTSIENGNIKDSLFSVMAYSGDTKLLSVWLGLPPWRLDEAEISSVLIDLGFEEAPAQ
jgi:hypothetical protein